MQNLVTVILAAGKGTRMKNPNKAKVMFEVHGKPMLEHVIVTAIELHSSLIITIVGFLRETVQHYIQQKYPTVEFAVQEPQLGTGHAILQTVPLLKNYEKDILVLSGDVPLLQKTTLQKLLSHHKETKAIATILTAKLPDPTGYGRIIRNKENYVEAIIEHRDASEEQKNINEINSGIYVFDAKYLFEALQHITPNNAQKEYYLTDVFSYFQKKKLPVSAQLADDVQEILGVNTLEQLQEVEKILQRRKGN